MTDLLTTEQRSENMRRIKSKNTKPELLIRKGLHRRGFRYRLHDKKLPGCPDIVLPKYSTIIEIRGCFWHGHDCHRGNRPKSHISYWDEKIRYNIEKDQKTEMKLKSLGWHIIIVWECQCMTSKNLFNTLEYLEKGIRHL